MCAIWYLHTVLYLCITVRSLRLGDLCWFCRGPDLLPIPT